MILLKVIIIIAAAWVYSLIFWQYHYDVPFQEYLNGFLHLRFFLVGFLVLLSAGFARIHKTDSPTVSRVLFFPAILITAILIWLEAPFYYIVSAISLCFLFSPLPMLRNAGKLLSSLSTGILVFSVCLYIYDAFSPSAMSLLSAVCGMILKIIGHTAWVNLDTITTGGREILLDPVKSGTLFYCSLLFPITAVIAFLQAPFYRKLYAFVVLSAGTLIQIILFSLFIVLYSPVEAIPDGGAFSLVYLSGPLNSSYYLFLFFTGTLYFYFRKEGAVFSVSRMNRSVMISALSVFIFSAALNLIPLRKYTPFTVIIDEIHSEWESTLIDFDMDIMGTMAENSYHSFADYLYRFADVSVLSRDDRFCPIPGVNTFRGPAISGELLKAASLEKPAVLMLKCPTIPYSKEEVAAIDGFIASGGSVFLVGDHTNVLFMNSFLNQISEKYGIEFNNDSIYMAGGGWMILGKNCYRPHQITARLNDFIWATNCSLKLTGGAQGICYSAITSFADHRVYTNEYFFGDRKLQFSERFGKFPVIAEARHKNGKIIAFTDSTCFNNYLNFTHARREFIDGIFGYLGCHEEYGWIKVLLMCISAAGFIFGMMKTRVSVESICLCAVCCAAGVIVSEHTNSSLYRPLKPIRPLRKEVLMMAANKPFHNMSYGPSQEFTSENSYDSIFFDTSRGEFTPRTFLKKTVTKEDTQNAAIMLFSPSFEPYSQKQLNSFKSAVERGVAAIIFAGNHLEIKNDTASLLKTFGFEMHPEKNFKVASMVACMNPVSISGGDPVCLIYDENSNSAPLVSAARFGKGMVIVIADDYLFTKININYYEAKMQGLLNDIYNAAAANDLEMLKAIDYYKYLDIELGEKSYYDKKVEQAKESLKAMFYKRK